MNYRSVHTLRSSARTSAESTSRCSKRNIRAYFGWPRAVDIKWIRSDLNCPHSLDPVSRLWTSFSQICINDIFKMKKIFVYLLLCLFPASSQAILGNASDLLNEFYALPECGVSHRTNPTTNLIFPAQLYSPDLRRSQMQLHKRSAGSILLMYQHSSREIHFRLRLSKLYISGTCESRKSSIWSLLRWTEA